MSERTKGATSDTTGETLGEAPNMIVRTLETSQLRKPKLTVDQPLPKLPLPSVRSQGPLLLEGLSHLRPLVSRPPEHAPVGWSGPLPDTRNIPDEQGSRQPTITSIRKVFLKLMNYYLYV